MKKIFQIIGLLLVLSLVMAISGCSMAGGKNKALIGVWSVENSEVKAKNEFFEESYMAVAKLNYYKDAVIEITKDGKFVVNSNVGTYEIVNESQIDITANGATTREKYAVDGNNLTLELFDGQIVVKLTRKVK